MMNVEYKSAWHFMFYANKATRAFLENNGSTLRNGYINDGLICYDVDSEFHVFYLLEKLYV